MSRENRILIVLASVFAVLSALVAAGIVAAVISFSPSVKTTQGRQIQAVSREQFKATYMGRSKAEVMDGLGKPTVTSQDYGEYWKYIGNYTYDAINGKPDLTVTLWFGKSGTVTDITFTS